MFATNHVASAALSSLSLVAQQYPVETQDFLRNCDSQQQNSRSGSDLFAFERRVVDLDSNSAAFAATAATQQGATSSELGAVGHDISRQHAFLPSLASTLATLSSCSPDDILLPIRKLAPSSLVSSFVVSSSSIPSSSSSSIPVSSAFSIPFLSSSTRFVSPALLSRRVRLLISTAQQGFLYDLHAEPNFRTDLLPPTFSSSSPPVSAPASRSSSVSGPPSVLGSARLAPSLTPFPTYSSSSFSSTSSSSAAPSFPLTLSLSQALYPHHRIRGGSHLYQYKGAHSEKDKRRGSGGTKPSETSVSRASSESNLPSLASSGVEPGSEADAAGPFVALTGGVSDGSDEEEQLGEGFLVCSYHYGSDLIALEMNAGCLFALTEACK